MAKTKIAKEYKLYIFMMEITDRTIHASVLFNEVIHLMDISVTKQESRALELRLASQAVTLVYHKQSHSFLKALKGKAWIIEMCLAETKIFPNEHALDEYIKKNKIKNGPLFGMSYNNFFF